jgi:hypothetical protein
MEAAARHYTLAAGLHNENRFRKLIKGSSQHQWKGKHQKNESWE